MPYMRHIYVVFLITVLVGKALTAANGHDESGDMAREMGASASASASASPEALRPVIAAPTETNHDEIRSYFALNSNCGLIYAHIVSMTLGWMFVLPIGVMLSIARSRHTMPIQLVFLVVNAIGLITGTLYNTRTPDLYENNAHHKFGWMLTWVVSAQVLMGFLTGFMGLRDPSVVPEEKGRLIPISENVMAQHQRNIDEVTPEYRFSNDSGQGTERASSSLRSQSSASSDEIERQGLIDPNPLHECKKHQGDTWEIESRTQLGSLGGVVIREYLPRFSCRSIKRLPHALSVAYMVLDRLILVMGFVALASGVVTYGGIMRGNHIFNGLAHFVKGGIFFWYGLLTLGRWMGCFADLGWAWNIKPSKHTVGSRKAAAPSAEFVESFVIFLYGSSNVFLEHLAAWGDAWTAQDLEHVSISVMFLGGGLCGMLVESTKIRGLLNFSIFPPSDSLGAHDEWQEPRTYRFSTNPLPGLIILLLGLMMSSHHQSSMVSTMVHKQWGTLLVGYSLARAITYIIFYVSPPASVLPSRPPSELISSFCLISAGLVFMASNKDTVAAMEDHGLDAMFVFTLTMGFTAFLMAWAVLVVAVKGWAIRHAERRPAKMPAA